MKKRRVALTLVFLLLISCFTSACGEQEAEGSKIIKAADKELQCLVPSTWRDATGTLNKVASLEVSREEESCYMIAIQEMKADFDADLDLEGYSKKVESNVRNMLVNPTIISMDAHKVGENNAILTKIEGELESVRITYWVCAVDFPEHYTMITAWTLTGKADRNEEALLSVIDSVSEITDK